MFYGPSGCGKTTFGGLIAKMVDSKPPDLVTINGADFRGIEMARLVNQECNVRPIASTNRMYMIDEFHMITKPAQNALLDVLERTPGHVYFVICTTNPEQVINTIKNRCTRYRVAPLRTKDCFNLLKDVAVKEEIKLIDDILEYIALASECIPRTALNFLEQVRNTSDPVEALEQLEGLVSDESTFGELLTNTIAGSPDWKRAFKTLKALSMDPEQVRRGLTTFCVNKLHKCTSDSKALYYMKCLEVLQPNVYAVNEAQLLMMVFELCFIQ
jgi:DNA polymerase-3 subunit gamma/tau